MKTTILITVIGFSSQVLIFGQSTFPQGVNYPFVQANFGYDQQDFYINRSRNDPVNGFTIVQSNSPVGQSFTPTLNSIEFVQLGFSDYVYGNGVGATAYVNLRMGSMSGAIMASSAQVFMPDNFGGTSPTGVTNFFFTAPVSLVPGTVYYLEAVIASGDRFTIGNYGYNYAGGSMFINGVAANNDLWFAEGIILPAPEPGTLGLGLLGVGVCWWVRRRGSRQSNYNC